MALGRLLASEADIELHCCYNAVEGIAQANQIAPTLILQDLVLPDIDGLAMVRLFRANPATAGTPIIVLSGNDSAETRAQALGEGANDYLVKLPPKAELVACIRRHAAPARGPAGLERHALPGAATESNETLDRSVLSAFGAPDFTRTLVDQFITEATSHLDTIREARKRRDGSALKTAAHNLKGSSMTMGARRLGALCAQVEAQAADDHVLTLDLMVEIDQEFVNLRNAFAAERQGITQP